MVKWFIFGCRHPLSQCQLKNKWNQYWNSFRIFWHNFIITIVKFLLKKIDVLRFICFHLFSYSFQKSGTLTSHQIRPVNLLPFRISTLLTSLLIKICWQKEKKRKRRKRAFYTILNFIKTLLRIRLMFSSRIFHIRNGYSTYLIQY